MLLSRLRPLVSAAPVWLGLVAISARAGASPETDPTAPLGDSPGERPARLELRGYGELLFALHDHGPDATPAGGAPSDLRLAFDQTRFVLETEAGLPGGFEFEAELEVEHGGAGVARELEYEEFGEYEVEVERGGEVAVEECYVERAFAGDALVLRLGRFYVASGLLSANHLPTEFAGAIRPESEERLIPGVWEESGFSLRWRDARVEATLQVVNGLDSTGFSSQFWISRGHQTSFETVRATGLAAVGRLDLLLGDRGLVGVSGYRGGTIANRPKPDMEGVHAAVSIVDVHMRLSVGPFRARAVALWGYLEEAQAISEHNRRLSNNLDVLRTPVASQAAGGWGEVSWDLGRSLGMPGMRVEPFIRGEFYDTVFEAGPGMFDNPRWERRVLGGGVAWTLGDGLVFKLDGQRRSFGESAMRDESTVRLSAGFVY